MWWETLIVGFLVAAAALWSGRQAVRSIRAVSRGRGCASGGCGLVAPKSNRTTAQPLELLQVGLDDLETPGQTQEIGPNLNQAKTTTTGTRIQQMSG